MSWAIMNTYGMAVDSDLGKLYMADFEKTGKFTGKSSDYSGRIIRTNLDGSYAEVESLNICGRGTKVIYFMHMISMRAALFNHLVQVQQHRIHALNCILLSYQPLNVIYIYNIYLIFWRQKVIQCFLEPEVLVSEPGMSMPYGVAVDANANQVYWTDRKAGRIQRLTLMCRNGTKARNKRRKDKRL